MSDFVLVILTSEGCGHCSQFRGNGIIGNGRQMHQYSFLESHIDPLKKNSNINIINIHFGSMSGNHNQIQVVSKFTKKGNYILQERYFPENGKTHVNVLTVDSKEKSKVLEKSKKVLIDNKDISWLEFLTKKIPVNIDKYSFFYPCFVIFKKDNWKEGKNILGIPNAGFVIRDRQGNYGLEKNGQSLQQRNILPQRLLIEAVKGELKFEPMKDLYVENKVADIQPKEIKIEEIPEKEEKKVEKEVKKVENKVEKEAGFVIKGYHDE